MGEQTLANDYDYVCHGKVYRFEESSTNGNMYVGRLRGAFRTDIATGVLTGDRLLRAVFVSFGGLLLYVDGPYKKLAPLRIDYVYLLLKK